MEPELANHISPFADSNELPVREANGVQGTFNVALPELNKLEEFGVVRGEVVLLPNERIEHAAVIGHPIVELGGREAVTLQHECGFSVVFVHDASSKTLLNLSIFLYTPQFVYVQIITRLTLRPPRGTNRKESAH